MLNESQSYCNELSDYKEDNLEARHGSERVKLVSAELLCNKKEHSS